MLVVTFSIFLLSAIGLSLGLAAAYDAMASANVRGARAVFYGAEAGLERAMLDLPRLPDWNQVLSGTATSGFRDGPPGGLREVPGGVSVSLDEWVNLANCSLPSACTAAAMEAVTEERRWGSNNPRWRLFAWGPLSALVPGLHAQSDAYLVVLAADDPTETDADATRDGVSAQTGGGVLLLRASAFGRGRAVRTIEATIARSAAERSAVGYEAQRGPASDADALSAPGGALARSEMAVGEGGMVRR